MIYDAHALLQKIEDILASIIKGLPKEYTNFRLHHHHKEIALVHRISDLNLQLEPLREEVDGRMFCTLPFKSSEYAQKLEKDIKSAQDAVVAYTMLMSPTLSEGRHVTTEVSTVRDRDMSVSRMELELASRKLADSMAYVRIYDKLHKYTDLLATATAALRS